MKMSHIENLDSLRPRFGNRFLTDKNLVFKHNAWDNVQWDSEQKELALKKVQENSATKLNKEQREKLEKEAHVKWDEFYSIHHNRFFKDRHWLFTEFPELNISDNSVEQKNKIRILEIGCGVGNTVFPILQNTLSQNIYVYACDFSSTAINLLKEHPLYDEKRCLGFELDITSNEWSLPFEKNCLDIVIMIFVLSAINPDKFTHIIKTIKTYLKPGGQILFRDYGRHDMAQLRFKNGRCISDNFYARGDGTRVYFFTQEEVRKLFMDEEFIEEQNVVDQRLQVNRDKLLKMYRVWIQGKYRKPKS